jgi:hypothetical protein
MNCMYTHCAQLLSKLKRNTVKKSLPTSAQPPFLNGMKQSARNLELKFVATVS